MARITKQEREDAKKYLLEILKPKDTVFLSLSSVSRSGMSRVIKCLDKDMRNISYDVALATSHTYVDGMMGGVRVGGCGMDMGLALIDHLSYILYQKPVDQNPNEDGEHTGGIRYRWI